MRRDAHLLPLDERIFILRERLRALEHGAGDHHPHDRSREIDQIERELWHLRGERRKQG